jgi:hypothetical protein
LHLVGIRQHNRCLKQLAGVIHATLNSSIIFRAMFSASAEPRVIFDVRHASSKTDSKALSSSGSTIPGVLLNGIIVAPAVAERGLNCYCTATASREVA